MSTAVCYFILFIEPLSLIKASLLYRYALMCSPTTAVGSVKVSFDAKTVSSGMKARHKIPAGMAIKETCSSMSSDAAPGKGLSIIQGSNRQLGPNVPRMILGPFRFVNHDCNPTAQVGSSESGPGLLSDAWQIYAVPDTHAYVAISLETIAAGADITVRYQQDGYYLKGCRCKTCTGMDPRDLSRLRQNVQAEKAKREAKAASGVASEGAGTSLPE
jgi:hypothetical protein